MRRDAALKQHGLLAVVIVMAFASVMDAGAVLRSGIHITWGIGKAQHTGSSPREEETECEGECLSHTPWPAFAAPALLLAVAIWIGMNAHVWDAIQRGSASLVDSKAHSAAVLGSAHTVAASVTLAAIVAAFTGLFRERIPGLFNSIFGPPLRLLRTLHSGIAAYTVWLILAVP